MLIKSTSLGLTRVTGKWDEFLLAVPLVPQDEAIITVDDRGLCQSHLDKPWKYLGKENLPKGTYDEQLDGFGRNPHGLRYFVGEFQ